MKQNNWKQSLAKACPPQRYILTFMGFLGVANAYIMRACLSIAITEMVSHPTVDNTTISDPDSCPFEGKPNKVTSHVTVAHKGGDKFDWNESEQGLILASFYVGYIFTHLPGGVLAQTFGGKYTLGLGILSTALFTLITPFMAYRGAIAVIITRFLMGLGEGTTFPALSTLLAQWAPPYERSQLSSFVFAGVQIGTVISTSLSGLLLAHYAWPTVFYVFGVAGIVWFIFWCLLCYSDPSSHPFITDSEKEFLRESLGQIERNKDLVGTPWSQLLCSGPVWALTIAEIGHDYGLFSMVTDLPKYMSDVMHFDVTSNGLLSSIPYLAMWLVSIFMGWMADRILAKKKMGITNLRKLLGTVGAVGPAIGVVLASYSGCHKEAVVALFTLGMGFMGFCYASLRVNALDLSPNYAGTIMAIVNGSGAISGMVAPYLIGLLTPNRTLVEWRSVFWVMFGVLFVTNLPYLFFGSGEVQPWNDPIVRIPDEELRRRSTISGGEPIREKYKTKYASYAPD